MKQTELGEIPVDWEVVKLGDVFQRSTRKNAENNQNALTISAQRGLISQTDYFNKTIASKNLLGYYLLHRGDFAYNKSYSAGYPMGVIKELTRYDKGVVSTLYICFTRTDKKSNSNFYGHYFEAGYFNAQLASIAQEGARAHGLLNVGVKDFFNLLIVKPPLAEQRKIAEILSTLDEKMAVMDEQLAQTQELKKGLMQRLLTKGIGHMQFKDSPLGEIPASWAICTLGDITKTNHQGINTTIEKLEYVEAGFPILQAKHITSGEININDARLVSENDYQKFQRKFRPEPRNLLLTNIGTIGRIVPVMSEQDFLVAWNIFIIRPTDEVDFIYLYYSLKLLYDKGFLDGLTAGNATKFVNKKQIESSPVVLPPLPEQHQIAEILTTVDEKIGVLQDKKAQYQTLKRGLMQQLLTGQRRVRVPALETAALL